ncbi:hypothetical protein ACPXCP_00015 [Streptomyces sp. DT20]|uniref:hypothetical protein n=1 Tax=unclassified Streptomyces TaxID=2593676 RepID=UPI002E2E7DAD|nr:hypothetical protein [Streptomyces sp. NBC_00304]WRZ13924.1 hypothetical protein OG892_25680 [Streptomyces sp. NBC_00341]
MKPLLWTVLVVAVVANVSLNLMNGREGLHIALSVVSGVVVLASGVRLWMLRTPREYDY